MNTKCCRILLCGGTLLTIVLLILPTCTTRAVAQRPPIKLLWKAGSRDCLLSRPVIDKDLLFFGTCDGKFYALEKRSGKEVWSYDSGIDGSSGAFSATPVVREGLVVAGIDRGCDGFGAGYVYAFDELTGGVRWKLQATVEQSGFVFLAGAIIFGASDGEWLSIQLKDGHKNWSSSAGLQDTHCGGSSSVATDGANVYVLSNDGLIYGLDGNSGRQLWKLTPDGSVTTTLFIYKDVLYFGTLQGKIYSINPSDGQPLGQLQVPATLEGSFSWSRKGERDTEYAYAVNRADGKGFVVAFSDEFERVLWSRASNELWTAGQPTPWKGMVIAGNCHGEITAYLITNGAAQWTAHVKGCITGVSVDDSTLYVVSKTGALYSLSPLP